MRVFGDSTRVFVLVSFWRREVSMFDRARRNACHFVTLRCFCARYGKAHTTLRPSRHITCCRHRVARRHVQEMRDNRQLHIWGTAATHATCMTFHTRPISMICCHSCASLHFLLSHRIACHTAQTACAFLCSKRRHFNWKRKMEGTPPDKLRILRIKRETCAPCPVARSCAWASHQGTAKDLEGFENA